MDLLDRLKIDELSEEQAMLAETIGLEAYRKLIRNYGGMNIYVPTARSVAIEERDKEILAAYLAGTTVKELSRKYDLSVVWIRKILQAQDAHSKPLPGQITLAELGNSNT